MSYSQKPKDFKIETITPDKIFNNKKKDGSPSILTLALIVEIGMIAYILQ